MSRLCLALLFFTHCCLVASGFQLFASPPSHVVPCREKNTHNHKQHRAAAVALPMAANDNNTDRSGVDRSQRLRKALEVVGEVQEGSELRIGSTVVAGNNVPNLGIWQFQSYELQSIYDQGVTEEGMVEKIPRQSLEEPIEPATYTRYVTLYSEKHHGPEGTAVIVSPKEVELTSMRDEVVDSILMALPLFGFWTALAFSFANQYAERTGGTLVDALFGR
jgi:hypothetical protein